MLNQKASTKLNLPPNDPIRSIEVATGIVSSFETLATFVDLTPKQIRLWQQAKRRLAQSCNHEPGTEFGSNLQSQVLEVHRNFGSLRHLKIWRTDRREITVCWDEVQAIKNERLGGCTLAVEIFPPSEDLVDEVNYRHLWEIPQGWNQLPLNLKW